MDGGNSIRNREREGKCCCCCCCWAAIMARNQEKSQAMLNKFLAAKAGFEKKPEERRPYLASMVDNLQEAQKWRNTLVRDISAKVMEIQNSACAMRVHIPSVLVVCCLLGWVVWLYLV